MSEITNNPIVLDSTGQVIVEKMKQQNALLAMIAEGKRDDIYNDIATIAHMVRTNDLDSIRNMFPIGDQIILEGIASYYLVRIVLSYIAEVI